VKTPVSVFTDDVQKVLGDFRKPGWSSTELHLSGSAGDAP
jgi:hypothetical protein